MIAACAVETCGGLENSGVKVVGTLATGIVGGPDDGGVERMGGVNEHLVHVVSVTAHIAISREVDRFRLALQQPQKRRATTARGEGNARTGARHRRVGTAPTAAVLLNGGSG